MFTVGDLYYKIKRHNRYKSNTAFLFMCSTRKAVKDPTLSRFLFEEMGSFDGGRRSHAG